MNIINKLVIVDILRYVDDVTIIHPFKILFKDAVKFIDIDFSLEIVRVAFDILTIFFVIIRNYVNILYLYRKGEGRNFNR